MKAVFRRTAAALARDLRVQYRAHHVGTAVAALAVWAVALRTIHPAAGFLPEYFLAPPFLFLNVYLMVFSLGMSQALCERKEGVLAALDLTPLRPHEFLAARCASLGLVAAIQTPLIVLAAGKSIESWCVLLSAICAEAVILSLAAFLAAAYAPEARRTLIRLAASLLLLTPPLLPFFGIAPGPWLIAHPLQGPLVLFQGAFLELPARSLATAVLSSGIWAAALLMGCRAGFERMRERM